MLFNTRTLGPRSAHRTNACTSRVRGRRARRPFVEALEGRALLTSITDLGIASPTAIYDSGQVAGEIYADGHQHAFLYSGGVMTDLGTLGGTDSYITGWNDSGQVVGDSSTADGYTHAFLYSGGVMTDLDRLFKLDDPNYNISSSDAFGINDSGQIVGDFTATSLDYASYKHAFIYSGGVMTDLGSLDGPFGYSSALGINNSGQVVGYSNTADSNHAFLYSGGSMTDLGSLGGQSEATGITDAGQVVGFSYTADGQQHAFLYSGGVMTDLGTLGGTDSYITGWNDSGQVVGDSSTADGQQHAFLYSGGVMTDLGTLGGGISYAYQINDAGQVVGESTTADGLSHAFLYSSRTGMIDLNSLLPANSGWTLTGATAINNDGQIVGVGVSPDGQGHAYLLDISPDIAVTSLSWDPKQGGVDFGYQVSGGALPANSSIGFYWASGPSEADKLEDQPIYSFLVSGVSTGSYGPYNVPASSLGPAPEGAEYLLAVAHAGPANPQTDSVMSVAYDPFTMDSATSPDPKDITFTYEVNEDAPSSDQPLAFGVYRSSSSSFDPSTAILVNTVTTDSSGHEFSEDLWTHTVTVNDPDALLPDPFHEYVYVVADPEHTIGDPDGVYHEAHYRKFVLGVVSHGLLPTGQVTGVPDWETQMAQDLTNIDGFDQVIPFDWSSTSNVPLPGLATAAGDRLAAQITSAADALVENYGSPGDVVDLDLIGHSRGAVVISQALQDLVRTTDKVLAGGYVKMTLLDPHPANNAYGLASFNGPFGVLVAGPALIAFQAAAHDPQVVIPLNVDAWDDVYQNTPSSSAFGLSVESLMNLWGDDPTLIDNESDVPPTIDENLTNKTLVSGALIGHSEVPLWYDQIDVQLRLIFPGYPLPGSEAITGGLRAPAAITQDASGPLTSNDAKPTASLVTQASAAPSAPSDHPTGNSQGIGASSPASVQAVASAPTQSPSSLQPAQPSLTTQVEVGSFAPLPPVLPSASLSVASTVAPQTQKVHARAEVPPHRTHALPRIPTKAMAITSARKPLSWSSPYA